MTFGERMRATQIATQYRRYYVSFSWRDKQARFSRHLAISFRPTTRTRAHSYGPALMRSLRVFLASHPLPHLLSSFQLPFLFLLLSSSFVLHACTQVTWEWLYRKQLCHSPSRCYWVITLALFLSLSLSLLHSFGWRRDRKKICIGISSWADRYARRRVVVVVSGVSLSSSNRFEKRKEKKKKKHPIARSK